MGRREDEKAAEASATRDFVMARLFAARGALREATDACDEVATLFLNPTADASGKDRKKLLEALDAACGAAAGSAQLAMAEFAGIDPEEEEPDPEDDDGDEEDDEDEDEDDEPAPARRRGR